MNSRQRNNNVKIFALIGLFVFFFGLFTFNLKSNLAISKILRNIASPAFAIKKVVPDKFDSIKSAFSSKKVLNNKILSLEERLQDLKNLEYENAYLQAQNETLLSLVDANNLIGEEKILAQVYSVSGIHPYGTLLIKVSDGEKKIKVGSVVYTKHSIAIGTVASVVKNLATVRLFSANNRSVEVIIGESENSIVATAMGIGSGNFEFTVPRDADIKKGDVVYSSAALGHPIAIVAEVKHKSSEAFTNVKARIPINLRSLTMVVIN